MLDKIIGPGPIAAAGFAAGALVVGLISAALWHFDAEAAARKLAKANDATTAAETRAGLCAASIEQIGRDSQQQQAQSVAAQQAEQKQEAAAEPRIVTVTKYIQEAPKCSEALQRAWQSAPQ